MSANMCADRAARKPQPVGNLRVCKAFNAEIVNSDFVLKSHGIFLLVQVSQSYYAIAF